MRVTGESYRPASALYTEATSQQCTASPLQTSLHVVSFQRCKPAHAHVQPCKLTDEAGTHCHVRASSTSACAFVYFTAAGGLQSMESHNVKQDLGAGHALTAQSTAQHGIFTSSPGCPEACTKAAVMWLVLLYFSRYCT